MNKIADLALEIAKKTHQGQFDKGGQSYIRHPVAVANLVESQTEKIVALLHDVCEDSDVTIDDLRVAGFSDNILNVVQAITKVNGESYEEYLDRVAKNPIATAVKIADMTHNSDLKFLIQVPRILRELIDTKLVSKRTDRAVDDVR